MKIWSETLFNKSLRICLGRGTVLIYNSLIPPLSIRLQKVESSVMVERELDYIEYHLSVLPRTRINCGEKFLQSEFCKMF